MPSLSHKDLIPCDKERKGLRLKMLLYALDELFYVFRKLGLNDVDGRQVLAYKILSLTSVCCTERHNGKPIDPHMTMGVTSTMMDVDDKAWLERLTWAMYNGVLLLGDVPPLSRQHSLDRILSSTYRLIYRGKQDSEHCPTSTISSANAKWALKETRWPHTPSVKSAVLVLPRAASSYQGKKGVAASLDYPTWEAGNCPFHQHHSDKMKFGGTWQAMALSPCQEASCCPSQKVKPIWRTSRWLEQCKNNVDEEEVEWWQLVHPLTDGSDVAMWMLAQRLVATWHWTVKDF